MPEETRSQPSSRQRMRLVLIILSFILYPVTFAYVSCPIITEAAGLGIVTGGLVVFALLFLGSLVARPALVRVPLSCGRPAGSLQPCTQKASPDKKAGLAEVSRLPRDLREHCPCDLVCRRPEDRRPVLPDSRTASRSWQREESSCSSGRSLSPCIFALIFGRRGFCHTFCPIAVMLMIGRKIRNLVGWPALHLEAEKDRLH